MTWKLPVAVLCSIALTASQASALTLTNKDDATYTVELIVGEGDQSSNTHTLENGASLSEPCENGCRVILSNGAEMAFEGGENVAIEDGEFVIAE